MTPRTEEQFEEIREEKKALIKNVALELFASDGYYDSSISKISKRAGISKGLMYNYFTSKEELIKEIIFDGMDEFVKVFDPNKDGVLTDEEFIYFIEESVRILKSNIKYWRLYFSIIFQPTVMKLVEDKSLEMMTPFYKILLDFFQRKGSKTPGIDARLFTSMMDGVSLNYVVDPENFPIEEIKQNIINMYK